MSGKKSALTFFITAAAGLLVSLFTLRMGAVFAELRLPLFFPPVWLLPVGWTAVLILLSAAVRHVKHGTDGTAPTKRVMTAYYVSLVLAVLWAIVFFRLEAKGTAVVVGLLLTGVWLHLMRLLEAFSPRAKKLMLPCCIWVGYLSYLHLGIWLINRG